MTYEYLKNDSAALQWRKHTNTAPLPQDYSSMTWDQLHELRSSFRDKSSKILDRVEKDGRDITGEENLAFKYGSDALDAIQAEFDRRDKAGTKEPIRPTKLHTPGLVVAGSGGVSISGGNDHTSRTYRGLFYKDEQASLSNGEFRSLENFIETLTSGKSDPRLSALENRTFISGNGVAGGYTVPEFWASQIFDTAIEAEIIRPRATVYPMQSDTLHVPSWDNFNHSEDGLYGGFNATWMGENQVQTDQTGKLRSLTLTANKLGIYTEISREAAADGIGLEQQLRQKLIKATSFYLDRAFLVGSGVAQPLGITNSPSLISVARNTANQVKYADLVSMYSRLHPSCANDAIWIASHSVLPQLMNMVDGASGLIWSPMNVVGALAPLPISLFGKPLFFTEKTPALGAKGDLILCSPSQYAIGLRQEAIIDVSNAPGWTRDVISLRVIMRVMGQSLWNEAVTPINGGDTLSWAVTLNA